MYVRINDDSVCENVHDYEHLSIYLSDCMCEWMCTYSKCRFWFAFCCFSAATYIKSWVMILCNDKRMYISCQNIHPEDYFHQFALRWCAVCTCPNFALEFSYVNIQRIILDSSFGVHVCVMYIHTHVHAMYTFIFAQVAKCFLLANPRPMLAPLTKATFPEREIRQFGAWACSRRCLRRLVRGIWTCMCMCVCVWF